MKNQLHFLLAAFSVLLLFNCTPSKKIHGLWTVQEVNVGTEEMTPIARWVKFEKNQTQTSGNGWVQHSEGTWELNNKTQKLSITNTNGFIDGFEPFSVKITHNEMIWNRKEEGQNVKVFLQKSAQIPQAPADKLYGIWHLQKVTENSNDVTSKFDPDDKRFLFLRWDKIFNIQNTPEGRISGIYKTHGHRNEIQMVFYGESPKIENWDFEVTFDQLILKKKTSEKEITKIYKRINQFLN